MGPQAAVICSSGASSCCRAAEFATNAHTVRHTKESASFRRLSSCQPVGGSSRPAVTAVGSSMLWFQSSFAHPPSDTACCRAGRGRESRTSRPRPLCRGFVSPDEQVPQGLHQCQSGSREQQEPTGKHRLYVLDVLRDGRVSPQSKFPPHPKTPPPEPVLGD